jgi:hypothetical protein
MLINVSINVLGQAIKFGCKSYLSIIGYTAIELGHEN